MIFKENNIFKLFFFFSFINTFFRILSVKRMEQLEEILKQEKEEISFKDNDTNFLNFSHNLSKKSKFSLVAKVPKCSLNKRVYG